jgi:hypothetical protein
VRRDNSRDRREQRRYWVQRLVALDEHFVDLAAGRFPDGWTISMIAR